MKILIVSTLKRNVSEVQFASRSRIIFEVASGLAERGHEVTLMGTADSKVPGVTIMPVLEKGWIDMQATENPFVRDASSLVLLGKTIAEVEKNFDIIHSHTYPDIFPTILDEYLIRPLVITLHAQATENLLPEAIAKSNKTYFIALSKRYSEIIGEEYIYDVVYNGVDSSLYSYNDTPDDYLFWLGRLPKGKNDDGTFIDPKGAREAIQVAQETNSRLYIGGIVEDPKFFENDIKPHLNEKIQWVGDVGSEQSIPIEKVVSLMQNAKAFLMTIRQEEPFGLVMAEAMSCGTPVIAFNRGSISEVVINGKTGFVVPPEEGIEGLKKAVKNIGSINRADCRKLVEEKFTVEKMVDNYEKVYERILKERSS